MGTESMNRDRPWFLLPLRRPMYNFNMNYGRMKPETKVRILRKFRSTLRHTIYLVNQEIEVLNPHVDEEPEVEAAELQGFVEMTAADVKFGDEIQVFQTMFGGFPMGKIESATVTGVTRPEEPEYLELVRIYHDGPAPQYGEAEEGEPVWVRRQN